MSLPLNLGVWGDTSNEAYLFVLEQVDLANAPTLYYTNMNAIVKALVLKTEPKSSNGFDR